jgi:hypothetical protein
VHGSLVIKFVCFFTWFYDVYIGFDAAVVAAVAPVSVPVDAMDGMDVDPVPAEGTFVSWFQFIIFFLFDCFCF